MAMRYRRTGSWLLWVGILVLTPIFAFLPDLASVAAENAGAANLAGSIMAVTGAIPVFGSITRTYPSPTSHAKRAHR